MKIHLKSPQEIEKMANGGKILSTAVWEVINHAKPGVSELELDNLAEKVIRKMGGEPGFKKVKGYHHTICASTNDTVVHGIPTSYRLKEGDVFGVDCGVFFEGFHTDMSETVLVSANKSQTGPTAPKAQKIIEFLQTGKKALEEAIKQVRPGNRIGHISQIIQQIVEKEAGYGVTRELIGHGV